jgi:hypothetical protein
MLYTTNVSINEVLCSLDPKVDDSGVIIQLQALENVPIFSHSFEVHDGTDAKAKAAPVDILVEANRKPVKTTPSKNEVNEDVRLLKF